jgi:uncharacterized protein
MQQHGHEKSPIEFFLQVPVSEQSPAAHLCLRPPGLLGQASTAWGSEHAAVSGRQDTSSLLIANVYNGNILLQRSALKATSSAVGFEWDEWSAPKIWEKHSVSQAECEQVFFNEPLIAGEDVEHSAREQRFFVLGVTDQGRELFLVFTLRKDLIRVTTAKDMSRRERKVYRNV